jgi:hypothetical protein
MHGPINVKSSNNTSKWQMEFNSAFKRLKLEKNIGTLREDQYTFFDHISLISS